MAEHRQFAHQLEAEGPGLFPRLAQRGRVEPLPSLDRAGRELDARDAVVEHDQLRSAGAGTCDQRRDLLNRPGLDRPGHGATNQAVVGGAWGSPARRDSPAIV